MHHRPMQVLHVALAPESVNAIDRAELSRVAAAIQRQVTRDFAPHWQVVATVDAFPSLEHVPLGYWPVIVTARDLGDDEGFHLSSRGEPYAVVEAISGWSITASHEILEMLLDPSGARTVAGPAPDFPGVHPPGGRARVEYLLEVCDPCQSGLHAYTVNDVLVSDFVTPSYFAPEGVAGSSAACSFSGNVSGARRLALGGALTYLDHARGKIVHVLRDERGDYTTEEHDLDETDRRPLRARIHAKAKRRGCSPRVSGPEHTLKATRKQSVAMTAMHRRASTLRAELLRIGTRNSLQYVVPTDADVIARINSALANRSQLEPQLVAILERALHEIEEIVAAASRNAPMKQEHFALSLVRSMMPLRPLILTDRDVPGLAKYDHEDVRWAKTLFEYVIHSKAEFPVCPVSAEPTPELVHPIGDCAVLAIAGDWGTHQAQSARIAQQMARLRPTHTIHLGDVYYAGTEDEERQFVRDWPRGSAGTFALNSNHEMYSGGHAYFGVALRSEWFDFQAFSYFALSTSTWIFVGLDSAYNATGSDFAPYDDGHLDTNDNADPQVSWLRRVLASPAARRADGRPKGICVFTHHQALATNGRPTALFAEVGTAMGRQPDLWYWGHIHGAAAYAPRLAGGVSFRGRLAGHGGIPYISDFQPADDAAAGVEWAERSNGDSVGANGFVVLRVQADALIEEFYDERGERRFVNEIRL